MDDAQLALGAVLVGLGAGLLRGALIERELASGQLQTLFAEHLDNGLDYYLCTRDLNPPADAAVLLAHWLLAESGQTP